MSSLVFNPEIVDEQQGYELGTVGWQQDKAFMYVRCANSNIDDNATTGGHAVRITAAGLAQPLTTTLAIGGQRVGVAVVDIPVGDYGWVQVYGQAHCRAAAGVAANAQCYSHATAGDVDDATASSAKAITGMKATAAGTAAAGVNVMCVWPYI